LQFTDEFDNGVLTLRVAERALVHGADWSLVPAVARADVRVVVVDLASVDFVSSLFLQGCMDLCRALRARRAALALLHLSQHQRRLVEMVDADGTMAVLSDPSEAEALAAAGAGGADEASGTRGVTRDEKRMLWS